MVQLTFYQSKQGHSGRRSLEQLHLCRANYWDFAGLTARKLPKFLGLVTCFYFGLVPMLLRFREGLRAGVSINQLASVSI